MDKELIVRYEAHALERKPKHDKQLLITQLSAEYFRDWKKAIDAGSVDEVLLCGPGSCSGWRIWVDRPVRFQARMPEDRHDAMCQDQAAHRIIQKGQLDVETTSPFSLVQEFVTRDKHYPWRVLVACTLLNRTHGRQVRPAIERLMGICCYPDEMLDPQLEEDILMTLQPLGLKTVRFKRLREMTTDYLAKKPFAEIRGAGQYALDSIDLFCWGKTDLVPTDQWLEPYRQWRLNGGPAVQWDREQFVTWWNQS